MSVLKYASDTAYNAVIGVPLGVIDTGFNIAETTWGIVGTALSILTAGKSQTINKWASSTRVASNILPNLYSPIVRVINPEASLDDLRPGVITSNIAHRFFSVASTASYEQGFFSRHIVSRLSYAVAAVASVVCRVADLALGLVGAAVAIVPCFGRSQTVNHFAVRHLTAFGVVNDVCRGLRGFVNPQQFVITRV